jgi:glycerol dehydrogenase
VGRTAPRVFAGPRRYVQGPGALDELGGLLVPYGRSPVVIVDGPVLALFGERLRASLAAAGLRPDIRVLEGEITYARVAELAEGVPGRGTGVVVGVGGGKSLDAAKAVALGRGLPVVTVPTAASNDSPASAAVAMYDEQHRMVSVDRLPHHPDLVLVDTAVIARAPVALLRSGIGDAVAKKFEADGCWAGTGSTPVGGRPLMSGPVLADACYRALRRHAVPALAACGRGEVTPDVEGLVEAVVLMAGLGFENGGLSLAHSLTRGLMRARGASRAMHGEQVAWGTLVQLAAEHRLDEELLDLVGFHRSVGLPVRLQELGMDEPTPAEVVGIARVAMTAPHLPNLAVAVDEAAVVAAIGRVEALPAR